MAVAKYVRLCQSCTSRNSMRAKFCAACGTPLADVVNLQQAKQTKPSNTFRAERRQLTVMFCDLVGSTLLSTLIDPEDLGEIIRRYRNLVQEEVGRLGGFVARLLGDGILIYFGYPTANEDDAARAVRAALNIIRGVAMLTVDPEDASSRPLQTHIGIHSGLVLIEGKAKSAYADRPGIIGETPNLAARIESVAPPGAVLVSPATYALTAKLFRYQSIGEVALRGFAKPVQLFQPLAESDWRQHLRGDDPAETAMIGRHLSGPVWSYAGIVHWRGRAGNWGLW